MKLKFKQSLVPRNQKFTIACSGGIDSVAISHYLATKWFKEKPKLLYVNNQMFTEDYIAAQNVNRLAKKLECEFLQRFYPVHANLGNGEKLCRETRMWAYDCEGNSVVVCHHLDDVVESYLMNCFNGTPEYKPIPEKTDLSFPQAICPSSKKIVRPFLLTITKKDLEAYCMANNLMQYVINDPLNAHSNRGWMRREIIPKINEKYPGLYKVVRKKYL